MADCLFCRIAAGEVPASIVHEDDRIVAFRDISPVAPTHILLVPRTHIASLADVTEADGPTIGHLFAIAADLARSEGLVDDGYRVVANAGLRAGQTIDHLHVHLLGGRAFRWPPG